jgi:hypothetical protein
MVRSGSTAVCWLTHRNGSVAIDPKADAVVINTRNVVPVPHEDRRDSLVFGEGGWQSLQGSPVGSHFYVENIRELLDAEGEWFHDTSTETLYLWRNSTQEAEQENATFVGTLSESVIRIVGSSAENAAKNIRVQNLQIRHTTTDFLKPYEAPGGGDQSAHRGGAIFIENASNVSIVNCTMASRFDVDHDVFCGSW